MAEYYFISQLPSLDGIGENTPLPISPERFTELCNSFLDKKYKEAVNHLTLSPEKNIESTGFEFIDAWNQKERALRLALCVVRAQKMKKTYDTENEAMPADCQKAAAGAVEIENPMEAEIYLNRYRLQVLEALRPLNGFSEDYIFYYGLKLMLISRIKQFSTELGEKAYRNIYDSIVNGDRLEAIQ